MNNGYQIKQLEEMGWFYTGSCACSEPADKLVKGDVELKISKIRDRWNAFKDGKVIRFGNKTNIINEVQSI